MDFGGETFREMVLVVDLGLVWIFEVCVLGSCWSVGFVWFGAYLGVW